MLCIHKRSAVKLKPVYHFIYFQPTVPIVFHRRNEESLERLGLNVGVEWKPDSSMLCISVIMVTH